MSLMIEISIYYKGLLVTESTETLDMREEANDRTEWF